MAFPFLFCLLDRRMFVGTMMIIILLCPFGRELVSHIVADPPGNAGAAQRAVAFFTPVHFDAFAAGSLVALATDRQRTPVWAGRAALALGIGSLVLYAAIYVAVQSHQSDQFGIDAFRNILTGRVVGQMREAFAYTAVWLASAGLLLATVARLPTLRTISRPRLFHAIGRVSYGGYVYHGFVLEVLARFVPSLHAGSIRYRLAFLAVLYPLTLILAFASFAWLERPFLQLGRRLTANTQPRPTR